MGFTIKIEELGNGFTVDLFDDEAPYQMDERIYLPTLKKVFEKIVKYYDELLTWRLTQMEESGDA